jgi:cephalosporin-C deacetylase-like acetyl esterase
MSPLAAALLFGSLLAGSTVAADDPSFAERARAFAYDATAPLDLQERSSETVDGVEVHDLTYASPMGGRVPAYLLVPPGTGRRAGLLFMHWGQGNRSEFLAEGVAAARAGAICLLIDAPYHRDEFQGPTGFANPAGERALFVQLVTDLRRGLDLLVARPDVDPARLGYVGHSLGATWGGALVGVDHRLRAAVLMGGLPSLTDPTHSYTDEFWALFREQYGEEKIRAYQAVIGPIDPEHFVSHAAPTRLLFQFARRDRFISDAAAKAYAAAASAPKEVRWYFTGHELNDQASLRDRAQWLSLQLRTRPIWAELQRGSKQP